MSQSVGIAAAFKYGIDRLTTRGGAILLGAYVLYQLLTQVSFQSLYAQLLADTLSESQLEQAVPLAIDLPATVAAVVTVLLLLAGLVLYVVATRAIYADINGIPTADHTRRLGRTVAVSFVVSVLYCVAVGIGFVALVIPGIFLAVSLVFAQLAVVLEDAGVVESFKRSWSLTSGNRLRLFAIGVILFVLFAVVGGVVGVIGVFVPVLGDLMTFAIMGVASIYGLAVLVGAYQQVATDADAAAGAL